MITSIATTKAPIRLSNSELKAEMASVIDQIPKMKIRETVSLWHNAIRILNDPQKATQHTLARSVLDSIGIEWERRGNGLINPDDYFDWPGTEANSGIGGLDSEDWIKEGVLKFLGYKVGDTDGEPQGVRERILTEIFCGPIPPVFPFDYLEEWGEPSSVTRLKKMAETIASLTRNAKRRRDSRMKSAVRDWEKDLEYLYYSYYVEKFHFAWPTSSI